MSAVSKHLIIQSNADNHDECNKVGINAILTAFWRNNMNVFNKWACMWENQQFGF